VVVESQASGQFPGAVGRAIGGGLHETIVEGQSPAGA
jgi:hypothetical protein